MRALSPPIATVQNLYNLTERKYENVLNYCTFEDIGSFRGSRWRPAIS